MNPVLLVLLDRHTEAVILRGNWSLRHSTLNIHVIIIWHPSQLASLCLPTDKQ